MNQSKKTYDPASRFGTDLEHIVVVKKGTKRPQPAIPKPRRSGRVHSDAKGGRASG